MALLSFGPPSCALVDYHLERGGMQLHDAFGVNCKIGATTENRSKGLVYGLRGVCLMIVGE